MSDHAMLAAIITVGFTLQFAGLVALALIARSTALESQRLTRAVEAQIGGSR